MKKNKRLIIFLLILGIIIMSTNNHVSALSKESNSLFWPADYSADKYWIAALDVYSTGGTHGSAGMGIDIYGEASNGQGTVYAIAKGDVTTAYNSCSHIHKGCSCGNGYGNYIKLKHHDGSYSLYAHLEQNSLTNKKSVKAGEAIGKIGSSGNSNGYHLHFEIFTSNNKRDYAFDYYIDNPEYQKKYLFRDGLQTRSEMYGDWIKVNYDSKAGNYWGNDGTHSTNDTKQPSAPTGVTAIKASSNTAKILWNPSTGASYYIVEYYKRASSTWERDYDYTNNKVTSYITTGLSNYDTYKFRVRAVNNKGKSDWTELTYDKTNASEIHNHTYVKLSNSYYEAAHPHKVYETCLCEGTRYTGETVTMPSCSQCNKSNGTVENFSIVWASSNTGTVSWDPISDASSYEVEFWSRHWNEWRADYEYSFYLGTKTTSYLTNGLNNSSYEFRVRAVFPGDYSDWVYFTLYR